MRSAICDLSHNLLTGLRYGQFDIVVAMTPDAPSEGVFMTWTEPLVWVGSPTAADATKAPLRIVRYPEGCLYRRNMLTALQRDGRSFAARLADLVISGDAAHGVSTLT